jgi:excisionase family DNA binding protein
MSTQHATEIGAPVYGLMTVNQLARLLGVSRWTIYRLVRDGEVRAVKVGERNRFRPEDVNAYLERQREGP